MNISLLEPIGISEKEIETLSKPIVDMGHSFIYYNNKTTDINELIKRSKDQDIVMIANNPYPKEVIESANKLKMIAVAFTGIDHVDYKYANQKGIEIINCAGYSNEAVSELVIGLAISLYRKINEADKATRVNKNSNGLMGQELNGKTVGIIGCGNIGIKTATLFKSFGCNILGYNHSPIKCDFIKQVEIDELLNNSDIISLHLPSNDETYHFIDEDKINKMKQSSIFINCARGKIVDNIYLARALNEERIAGAAIDVYDIEPPLNNDYPLLNCKNIILTPHVAFLTKEAMIKRANIEFNNVIEFLKKQK